MGDSRKVSMLRHRGDKRGSITNEEDKESDPSDRSLQLLAQDREGDDQFICESIDVVDACRGTSNSNRFRGNFLRYEGPCRKGSRILDGYPIYKTAAGPNQVPKYMYAIDVYSDSWSVEDLQGLVRWRIVDFEDFMDQTTCRTESANVNQIDFASDGQPYNFFPTIYCFDENGGELDGYKSSTINIRCNDRKPPVGFNGDGTGTTEGNASAPTVPAGDPSEDQSKITLLLGVLLVLTALSFAVYFLYNRYSKRKPGYSKSDGRSPTKATEEHTDSDSDHNDRKKGLLPAKLERAPSAPDMGFRPRLHPDEHRPFSSNSIMVDSSSHSGSADGGLHKASMHTVSKPYELVKRRAAKLAPEPPRTSSPLPELDFSVAGNDFPRSITIGAVDEMDHDDSYRQKQQQEQQQLEQQMEKERLKQQQLEQERLKRDQLEREQLKQERLKREQIKQERLKRDQLEREQLKREKLKQEQLELEQLKREKLKQRQLEQKRAQQQREERQEERGRDPSEKDYTDDGTFMSESLSNLFQNIDESLDQAISSEEKGSDVQRSGRKTSQYEYVDPPEQKATPSSRNAPSSSRGGKNDDMDQSRRSNFADARGRWSARGKPFTKNQDRFRDNVVGDLWMSEHDSPSTRHQQQRRSKSLDTTGANEYTKSKRSRSKERSGADTYAQQRTGNTNSRSRSKERSNSNAHAETNRRSRSREQSGANDYHSGQRTNNGDRRSPSRERSGANNHASQNNRSRSRERSRANAFAAGNTKRSKSKERSDSNAFARNDNSRRGRSQERSKANDYASGKGRSKSMEQSEANKAFEGDNRKRYPENRVSGNDSPKGRSRSHDASKAKNYADRTRSSGNDVSKTRSRSYDPSDAKNYAEKRKQGIDKKAAGSTSMPTPQKKPSTTIIKNKDGTILVARRRKRDDGATVVTKTKYANMYLARKHGVNV